MKEFAYKCYLGLALEETIKELNLDSIKDSIFDVYYASFNRELTNKLSSMTVEEKTKIQLNLDMDEYYDYPIGESGDIQYLENCILEIYR